MVKRPRSRYEHARRSESGVSSFVFSLLVAGLVALCLAVLWPVIPLLDRPSEIVTSSSGVSPTLVTEMLGLVVIGTAALLLGCVLVVVAALRSRIRAA